MFISKSERVLYSRTECQPIIIRQPTHRTAAAAVRITVVVAEQAITADIVDPSSHRQK